MTPYSSYSSSAYPIPAKMHAKVPATAPATPVSGVPQPSASGYSRLDRYFEAEVLNADPVKLVLLLYRGALEAVAKARVALENGDIAERSTQILKAWEILNELRGSLNLAAGGELAQRLHELYVFAAQRLLDANAEQADKPLQDAFAVLTILGEAWQALHAQQPAAPKPEREPLSVAC